MQFLPVLLVKEKKIHIYGINVKILDFEPRLNTFYYLDVDLIRVKNNRDVLYFGTLNTTNSFCISDEFIDKNILYKELLENIHNRISLNSSNEIISDMCRVERIYLKTQEEPPEYSVAFSIGDDEIGLYTISSFNTDMYTRILGKVSIDKYSGQRVSSIKIPIYKLYHEDDIDGDVLNYLENSVNIKHGLLFLNTILLRYIFSRSSISDPINFSKSALSQKTKFLN